MDIHRWKIFHVLVRKIKLSGGQSTSHHHHLQFTVATRGTLISLLSTQIVANGKFVRTSAFRQAIAVSAKICFQQQTIQKFDPLALFFLFFLTRSSGCPCSTISIFNKNQVYLVFETYIINRCIDGADIEKRNGKDYEY